ncbi:MAG TPA: hypothetical protein VL688_04975 [Verrucomicrobiae bacterium]|nr:hypothetical protein [Verrucomicrobiae bacterium]
MSLLRKIPFGLAALLLLPLRPAFSAPTQIVDAGATEVREEKPAEPTPPAGDSTAAVPAVSQEPKKLKSWQTELNEAREDADLSTPEGRKAWRQKKRDMRHERQTHLAEVREKQAKAQSDTAREEAEKKSRSYVQRNKEALSETLKSFEIHGNQNKT